MSEHPAENLSEEAALAILDGLPSGESWKCFEGIEPFEEGAYIGESAAEYARRQRDWLKARSAAIKKVKRSHLVDACCSEATDDLLSYLRALAEDLPVGFRIRRRGHSAVDFVDALCGGRQARSVQPPFYFVRVAEAILRFMDRRAAKIESRIASTEVARLVFHWLQKAHSTRYPIIIEGNSRFGKTEAVKAWAMMFPGLARYVRTPPSTSEGDLLRAIAASLGIDGSDRLATHRLRAEIEHVLKHSGLMLLFDEAQSLFPSSFGRNTAPARLNYVRCSVLDAGLPAAFICTPQSYRTAEKKFVRATGFAIDQWSERILKTLSLPDTVGREDLFAIARIHFPGLSEIHLAYIVDLASATERNYVSDVSKIARLAYSNAQDAGCQIPKLEHIDSAIADVLPSTPKLPAVPAPDNPGSMPLQAPCTRAVDAERRRPVRPSKPAFDRSRLADAATLLPG